MLQITKYEINKNILTVGFKENNFVVYVDIAYDSSLSKQELLQKAYVQVKSTIEYEKTQAEHSIITVETGEEFIPETSKPTRLIIDFCRLKGKALDQYGEFYSTDIAFSVEGTDKAIIQNREIIEQEVAVDAEYYIVAKYNDLVEKQKRTIYAPKIANEPVNNNLADVYEAIISLDNRISKIEEGK
jgi:Txe/YoeB family toxin of Txe-Axe toxin-antitoxin module